jgi:hypothetical protein
MELTIRPFQSAVAAPDTALSGGTRPGLGRAARWARSILGRYRRLPAQLAPLELALQRAQPGYVWQNTWRLHLAAYLRLASLPALPVGRTEVRSVERRLEAFRSHPRAPLPLLIGPALRRPGRLEERMVARERRISALNPHPPKQTGSPEPSLVVQPPQAAPDFHRPPAPAAARVLLQPAPLPAPALPPAAQAAPPAAHEAGQGLRLPGLRLDQFPAHEVSRLADQVIATIDRRILAQRERFGRL